MDVFVGGEILDSDKCLTYTRSKRCYGCLYFLIIIDYMNVCSYNLFLKSCFLKYFCIFVIALPPSVFLSKFK